MKRYSPHDEAKINEDGIDGTTIMPRPFDAFESHHGSIEGTTPRKLTLGSPDANISNTQSPFFSTRACSSSNTESNSTNPGLEKTKLPQTDIGNVNFEQPNFFTENTTTPTTALKEKVGHKMVGLTPISCDLKKKGEGLLNLQGDSTQFATHGEIPPFDLYLSNQT